MKPKEKKTRRKRCNQCGYKNNELTLSDREWICPICKTHHDRDLNAAKNIKREGINLLKNSTGLMPESYACKNMSEEVNNSVQEIINYNISRKVNSTTTSRSWKE